MKQYCTESRRTASVAATQGDYDELTHDDSTPARREAPRLKRGQAAAKRGFDVLVAVVGSVVFSPVILVSALSIWLYDFKSPIFKQLRVGRNGKAFTLYKFRSMRIDSEGDGVPRLCQDHDDRLTPVGAFLRNHHLDEFPQLWNVLRGDMSVVGPRPERPFFSRQIAERYPDYTKLYALRPGLFSEATLRNGYTDTIDKMVTRAEMDMHYLKNYSFWTDIRIIWQTSVSILTGKKF